MWNYDELLEYAAWPLKTFESINKLCLSGVPKKTPRQSTPLKGILSFLWINPLSDSFYITIFLTVWVRLSVWTQVMKSRKTDKVYVKGSMYYAYNLSPMRARVTKSALLTVKSSLRNQSYICVLRKGPQWVADILNNVRKWKYSMT